MPKFFTRGLAGSAAMQSWLFGFQRWPLLHNPKGPDLPTFPSLIAGGSMARVLALRVSYLRACVRAGRREGTPVRDMLSRGHRAVAFSGASSPPTYAQVMLRALPGITSITGPRKPPNCRNCSR